MGSQVGRVVRVSKELRQMIAWRLNLKLAIINNSVIRSLVTPRTVPNKNILFSCARHLVFFKPGELKKCEDLKPL